MTEQEIKEKLLTTEYCIERRFNDGGSGSHYYLINVIPLGDDGVTYRSKVNPDIEPVRIPAVLASKLIRECNAEGLIRDQWGEITSRSYRLVSYMVEYTRKRWSGNTE